MSSEHNELSEDGGWRVRNSSVILESSWCAIRDG